MDVYLFGFLFLMVLAGFSLIIRSSRQTITGENAYLIGVRGAFQNQRIDLPREAILGRSGQVYLNLPQPNVSRYHCRIWSDNVNWYIQDLQSQTGTFLNGRAIQQAALQDQDLIQIGENIFRFYLRR